MDICTKWVPKILSIPQKEEKVFAAAMTFMWI